MNQLPTEVNKPVCAGSHRYRPSLLFLLMEQLTSIPSFYPFEGNSARVLRNFLQKYGVTCEGHGSNCWSFNRYFDRHKVTILLHARHDTARPCAAYPGNPLQLSLAGGSLKGHGVVNARAALAAMTGAFLELYTRTDLPFNLCFLSTAEPGEGLSEALKYTGHVDFAILGEPTGLEMAIASPGQLILHCSSSGRAGAAAGQPDNAIYRAMADINWFLGYRFPKEPGFMPPMQMTVTEINAGIGQGVVPDLCTFTVHVQMNGSYSPDDVLQTIAAHTSCTVRLGAEAEAPCEISRFHPVVQAGLSLGLKTCVAGFACRGGQLAVPSLALGPGNAALAHTPEEAVTSADVIRGKEIYVSLLNRLPLYLINPPAAGAGQPAH